MWKINPRRQNNCVEWKGNGSVSKVIERAIGWNLFGEAGRLWSFSRMLKNALRANIVNKSSFTNQTFGHGDIAPGTHPIRQRRNFRWWWGVCFRRTHWDILEKARVLCQWWWKLHFLHGCLRNLGCYHKKKGSRDLEKVQGRGQEIWKGNTYEFG